MVCAATATMSSDASNDFELKDVRKGHVWARAHLDNHAEGTLKRNSADEPRDTAEGNARWTARALGLISSKSFRRNPRKRALWTKLLNEAYVPEVPAGLLDGNARIPRAAKADATVTHYILAFLTGMIEDADRRAARTDLNNATIRQGTKRVDEFLEQDFDPAVLVAGLEDSQYAEKLLAALNDGIHKKLVKAQYRGLQSGFRVALGNDRWTVKPADARLKAIELDLSMLTVAQDEPFFLDDYLIPEEKAAALTDEAIALAKVAAVQKESSDAVASLEKRVNERFGKVEAKVEAIDTEVKAVTASIGDLMKAFTAGQQEMKSHMEMMSTKIDGIGSRRPRPTCSHCGKKGHSEAKCWELHPEMRPGWAE